MDENEGAGLPPGIEQLWGLRERSRRGPRPGLNVPRIVQAGIEIADAEGLGALSMSRVADRLGFTTMSLYRHVANKEELFVLMWSTALDQPPPSTDPADGWRAAVKRWCDGQVASFVAHPWLLQVPITGPPVTPGDLTWMEAGLRALAATGLPEGDKIGIILALNAQARYQAKLYRDLAEAARTGQAGMADYGNLLRKLLEPERFPAIWRSLESGVLDEPSDGPPDESELEYGLHLLLDGIQALIRKRTSDRPGCGGAAGG